LAQDFWDVEKTIKVVVKNLQTEAVQFRGSDLKGNTDLNVVSGSMAPRSRTAQQAFITELIKLGIIPPEKGLRYLEMSSTDALYHESQIDARHAQRENLKMANEGVEMPINPWDNVEVHFYEHSLYLKSQEFETLDDEKKQYLITHFLLTQQQIQEQYATQQPVPANPDEEGTDTSE
jgi:hypothetical protein